MTLLVVGLMVMGVLWLAFALGLRNPAILVPLLVGGALRVGMALIGWHAVALPYSTSDAVGFERGAWRMASDGWSAVLDGLNPVTGFSYVAPFAAIYATVGRVPHALLLYNAFLGVIVIALVYRIGLALGGKQVGIGSAYVMAIFPASILMSSVILRESAVAFGVALGMFGLVEADRKSSAGHLVIGVLGLVWAAVHHGGVVFPAVLSLLAFTIGRWRTSVEGGRVHVPTLAAAVVAMVILVGASAVLAPGQLRLASVGVINFETVEREVLSDTPREARGGSSYYGGTTTESWGQAVRQLPGRVTLFMVSPLPWTVRSANQVAGLIDGLLWGLALLLFVKYRRVIWRDPRARILLFFLALAVTTYALGTTNAGTALRHRTKFAPALIPLAVFALMAGQAWLGGTPRPRSIGEATDQESGHPDPPGRRTTSMARPS